MYALSSIYKELTMIEHPAVFRRKNFAAQGSKIGSECPKRKVCGTMIEAFLDSVKLTFGVSDVKICAQSEALWHYLQVHLDMAKTTFGIVMSKTCRSAKAPAL